MLKFLNTHLFSKKDSSFITITQEVRVKEGTHQVLNFTDGRTLNLLFNGIKGKKGVFVCEPDWQHQRKYVNATQDEIITIENYKFQIWVLLDSEAFIRPVTK